jgi:hypothetical protein
MTTAPIQFYYNQSSTMLLPPRPPPVAALTIAAVHPLNPLSQQSMSTLTTSCPLLTTCLPCLPPQPIGGRHLPPALRSPNPTHSLRSGEVHVSALHRNPSDPSEILHTPTGNAPGFRPQGERGGSGSSTTEGHAPSCTCVSQSLKPSKEA